MSTVMCNLDSNPSPTASQNSSIEHYNYQFLSPSAAVLVKITVAMSSIYIYWIHLETLLLYLLLVYIYYAPVSVLNQHTPMPLTRRLIRAQIKDYIALSKSACSVAYCPYPNAIHTRLLLKLSSLPLQYSPVPCEKVLHICEPQPQYGSF